MAHWVKCTTPNKTPAYVNLDKIISIYPGVNGGSSLQYGSDQGGNVASHVVAESPTELLNLPAIAYGNAE